MLIEEHFDERDQCPLCRIKATVNDRLTEQYLGDGVMEDDTRKEVNKLGFCAHHYKKLFNSRSKIGLALQVSTRLNTVNSFIEPPKGTKQAQKQAEEILKLGTTCVVCKYLDEHMVRYYKTVAEVYKTVASFKDKLKKTHGFCLEHYAQLLKYSGYAGGKQKEYTNDLYELEASRMAVLGDGLHEFCMRHDYRTIGAPLSENASNALKTASKIFYGEQN